MSRPARQPARRAAFTLMEVLLATSLLAVVSVMIYRSLSAATRFYEHANRKMEALGGQRIDRSLLALQMASVRAWPLPYTPKDRAEGRRWFFRLEPGRLEFLSTASLMHPPDGRLRLVRWQPDEGEGLLVEERVLLGRLGPRDLPDDEELALALPYKLGPAEQIHLADGRAQLRLSVPVQNAREGGMLWSDDLTQNRLKFLPEAVRLTGMKGNEDFIWHFPLAARYAGWPSYQPEEEIETGKKPRQPDKLDIQLQQAWEGKGAGDFKMGEHGHGTIPQR